MIRPSVLWLAAAMAALAIWHALVTQTLDVQSALLRFLIAVPIAAVMVGTLRVIVESYRRQQARDEDTADADASTAPGASAPPIA